MTGPVRFIRAQRLARPPSTATVRHIAGPTQRVSARSRAARPLADHARARSRAVLAVWLVFPTDPTHTTDHVSAIGRPSKIAPSRSSIKQRLTTLSGNLLSDSCAKAQIVSKSRAPTGRRTAPVQAVSGSSERTGILRNPIGEGAYAPCDRFVVRCFRNKAGRPPPGPESVFDASKRQAGGRVGSQRRPAPAAIAQDIGKEL